jgi:hypothetical protein
VLTTDLVQTRVSNGRVVPEYLDPDDPKALEKATSLVEIFAEALEDDAARGEVETSVDRVVGYGTDFKVWRGLAKLLYDRSTFETRSPVEPADVRRTVFELAARSDRQRDRAWRRAILEEAADELGLEADTVERILYADLDERQRLDAFDPMEPKALLHRYNLALAQAVLYKATELEIELQDLEPNALRYLFQSLKFNRLMHRVRRTEEGYRLAVDGPASLFNRSRKYGIHMAKFLPALVKLDGWQLKATLDWEEQERRFEVSAETGLVSHYRARGQWKAEEEAHFEQRFDEIDPPWELERQGTILDLGDNEVIIPDYVLSHPDGREAYLEIVGFWRLSYLKRRIEALSSRERMPLILAVSERLKAGREALEQSPASVFFFKTVILVDNVVDAAEEVARPAEEVVDGRPLT